MALKLARTLLVAAVFTAIAAALPGSASLSGPLLNVHPDLGWPAQASHDAAFSDSARSYYSVYNVSTETSVRIEGVVVDPDAIPAVGVPVVLAAPDTGNVSTPAVAWNPSTRRYLVVFDRQDATADEAVGIVVDDRGFPVGGSTPFQVSSEGLSNDLTPEVACDGKDWLVLWRGHGTAAGPLRNKRTIRGRRVEGSSGNSAPAFGGAIFEVSPTSTLVADYHDCRSVSSAFGTGPDYLVVWKRASSSSSGSSVWGRTVSPAGVLGTPQRYHDLDLVWAMPSPVVAANASTGGFLVGWISTSGQFVVQVRGADAAGVPVGQVIIPFLPKPGSAAQAAWDSVAISWNAPAAQYLVTWFQASPTSGSPRQVLGARLGAAFDVLDTGIPIGNPGNFSGNGYPPAPPLASLASASSGSDSGVLVLWQVYSELDPAPPFALQAQLYDLAGLRAPGAPAAGQFRLDGTTPIAPGGETNQAQIVVRAPVFDGNGDDVTLEIEVAAAGIAFSNIATRSSARVPSGSIAALSVPLPGFAPGQAYHWQARGVDSTGLASRWKPFHSDPDLPSEVDVAVRSTNAAPALAALEQDRGSGSGVIPPGGGLVGESSVVFRADAVDPDSDDLELEVELRPVGEAFRGQATLTGSWTRAGASPEATATFSAADEGLAIHWQARVVDSFLEATPWQSFGGNPEPEPDFIVQASGSANVRGCGLNGAARPVSGGGWILAGAAALVALSRRPRIAALGLLALLLPPGGSTPVGPVIAVDPDVAAGASWPKHALAYAASVDRYVSVYATVKAGADIDLFGAAIDAADASVGTRIDLDTSAGSEASQPAIAWNPAAGRFLVVFMRADYDADNDVTRYRVHGLVLDETGHKEGGAASVPFPISLDLGALTSTMTPQVACDGTNWLVVWSQTTNGHAKPILGRFVSGTSTNAAPAFDASAPFDIGLNLGPTFTGGIGLSPSLAFLEGSDVYLVTWSEHLSGTITIYGVFGRAISPGGSLGTPNRYDSGAGQSNLLATSVSANSRNGEFVVAWAEDSDGNSATTYYDDVRVRRVGPTGAPLASAASIASVPKRKVVAKSISALWNRGTNQYFVSRLEEDVAASGAYNVRATRLKGNGAVLLEQDIAVAEPARNAGANIVASADRGGQAQVLVQWQAGGAAPTPLQARRFDLGPNPDAPLLSAVGQFRVDGVTAIAAGQETNQAAFVAVATATDPNGDPVRLQVEVRERGASFSGIPTATGASASSGSTLQVGAELARGKKYHWQVRAVDGNDEVGPWTSFGTQPDDPAEVDLSVRAQNGFAWPVNVAQQVPGGGAIPVGREIPGAAVTLEAELGDPDGDDVALQVELRPVGVAFTGEPSAESPLVATGRRASLTVSGLDEGPFHWRCRSVDSALETGPWIAFGGNEEGDVDFRVEAKGSSNIRGICSGAAAGTAGYSIFFALFIIAMKSPRKAATVSAGP